MIFLIFHNTLYYIGGIVTCHVDHDVFDANFFDTWNVSRAIENEFVQGLQAMGNSLVLIVVVFLLCPQRVKLAVGHKVDMG